MRTGRAMTGCQPEWHGRTAAVTGWQVVGTWAFDPLPTVAVLVTGGLYAAARRRAIRRGGAGVVTRGRTLCFSLGLAALLLAVDGPPDVFAEWSFSAHMT